MVISITTTGSSNAPFAWAEFYPLTSTVGVFRVINQDVISVTANTVGRWKLKECKAP